MSYFDYPLQLYILDASDRHSLFLAICKLHTALTEVFSDNANWDLKFLGPKLLDSAFINADLGKCSHKFGGLGYTWGVRNLRRIWV